VTGVQTCALPISKVSIGEVKIYKKIAVVGNKNTTVSKIAKPLLATTGFIDRIIMSINFCKN
jgi:hypothetical protein